MVTNQNYIQNKLGTDEIWGMDAIFSSELFIYWPTT